MSVLQVGVGRSVIGDLVDRVNGPILAVTIGRDIHTPGDSIDNITELHELSHVADYDRSNRVPFLSKGAYLISYLSSLLAHGYQGSVYERYARLVEQNPGMLEERYRPENIEFVPLSDGSPLIRAVGYAFPVAGAAVLLAIAGAGFWELGKWIVRDLRGS